jgi:hypothetical protein
MVVTLAIHAEHLLLWVAGEAVGVDDIEESNAVLDLVGEVGLLAGVFENEGLTPEIEITEFGGQIHRPVFDTIQSCNKSGTLSPLLVNPPVDDRTHLRFSTNSPG